LSGIFYKPSISRPDLRHFFIESGLALLVVEELFAASAKLNRKCFIILVADIRESSEESRGEA